MEALFRNFIDSLTKELNVSKFTPNDDFKSSVMSKGRYYRLLKNSETMTILELKKLSVYFNKPIQSFF